ncbi:MAG: potassium-transporting ATPase subunit F [Rhizobiales bacterium 35-68-8]|nr:MAG: potassium-transporting ATPase subunit F [Rhizobiales bacterium 35-68-8]
MPALRREADMLDLFLGGGVAFGLAAYLLVALVRPEKF